MQDPKYLAAKQLSYDLIEHLARAAGQEGELKAIAASLDDLTRRCAALLAGVSSSFEQIHRIGDDLCQLAASLKPPLPTYRSGFNYQLGFREPANSYAVMTQSGGKYDQIEAWLGRRVDLIPCFLGSDQFNKGWSNLVTNYVLGYPGDPKGQLQGIYDRGSVALFGMPIMPTSFAHRYDLGAAGAFDEPHRAVYRRMREIVGDRQLLLRLGWEVNDGYPWSWIENSAKDDGTRLTDDQDWRVGAIPDTPRWRQFYIDTFRRLVDVARAELPGVVICWNHLRDTRRNVGAYFPGNSHVDRVTMDPYDAGWGGYVVDEASWDRFKGVYRDDSFNGPEAMLLWADAHDLDIGFDEWGCWNKTPRDPARAATGANLSPASETNNGFYVRKMYGLFDRALEMGRLKHQAYFQTGSTGIHQLWPETDWNANVRAAYLELTRPQAA